jgi:hypothetical protein
MAFSGVGLDVDGSINLYLAAEPPNGDESNWLYVAEGKPSTWRSASLGPNPVRDGSWSLNDLERLSVARG